jgi:hypothetical protein
MTQELNLLSELTLQPTRKRLEVPSGLHARQVDFAIAIWLVLDIEYGLSSAFAVNQLECHRTDELPSKHGDRCHCPIRIES